MERTELISGCLDTFCYNGYDVVLKQQTSPVPENRKMRRKVWHLYRHGKFTGLTFKTDKEVMAYIDGPKEFSIDEHVVLHFDEPSAIGYNGMLCKISMICPTFSRPYLCESIYGTGAVWAKAENLVKQRKQTE